MEGEINRTCGCMRGAFNEDVVFSSVMQPWPIEDLVRESREKITPRSLPSQPSISCQYFLVDKSSWNPDSNGALQLNLRGHRSGWRRIEILFTKNSRRKFITLVHCNDGILWNDWAGSSTHPISHGKIHTSQRAGNTIYNSTRRPPQPEVQCLVIWDISEYTFESKRQVATHTLQSVSQRKWHNDRWAHFNFLGNIHIFGCAVLINLPRE